MGGSDRRFLNGCKSVRTYCVPRFLVNPPGPSVTRVHVPTSRWSRQLGEAKGLARGPQLASPRAREGARWGAGAGGRGGVWGRSQASG